MKSDYKSSNFSVVIFLMLLMFSIVPLMLLWTSTAYPLFIEFPEMTTITVSTKRCFWICSISVLCQCIMFGMYIYAKDVKKQVRSGAK